MRTTLRIASLAMVLAVLSSSPHVQGAAEDHRVRSLSAAGGAGGREGQGREVHSARIVWPTEAATGGVDVVAGELLTLRVELDGPPLPAGMFPAVNADVVSAPPDASLAIVTGFPESELTFMTPGEYVVRLSVTLVCKTSCGGAYARGAMRKDLKVVARQVAQ